MRRLAYMLSGLIIMVGISNTSNAATKCVALNAANSCSNNTDNLRVDWGATCANVAVKGIGVCAGIGGSFYQIADTVPTVNTSEGNKYCWCKMTSPAVSKFVYVAWDSSATQCSVNCALRCGSKLRSDTEFRTILFSNFE